MEIINQNQALNLSNSIVIFGNFDGVHKGHQLLIQEALKKKKEFGYVTSFFTFEPHPTFVITGKEPVDIIFTPEEKKKVVKDYGIDYYIEFQFDMTIAKMAPELFVENVIHKQLNAKYIIVGEDYRFGSKRSGDVQLLKELGKVYGFEVMTFHKMNQDNRIISSTWLRETIREGNMEKFYTLTDRHFSITGKVEHGRAIGRTIGIPTANVSVPKHKILPPNGVYASYTTVAGVRHKSIANVGKKPNTENERIVESYILDFDEMIYGETIQIEMTHYMRSEQKLESLDHLKKLIKKDLENLDDYFKHFEESYNSTRN